MAGSIAMVYFISKRWRRRREAIGESGGTVIDQSFEKDGVDILELHGKEVNELQDNVLPFEAGSKPLHELPVHPLELEGDEPTMETAHG